MPEMLLVASLLLVVRPGAPSSVLAPSSKALVTSSDARNAPFVAFGSLLGASKDPSAPPSRAARQLVRRPRVCRFTKRSKSRPS